MAEIIIKLSLKVKAKAIILARPGRDNYNYNKGINSSPILFWLPAEEN